MEEFDEENHFWVPPSVVCGFHCHTRISQRQRNITYTWVTASSCRHHDPDQHMDRIFTVFEYEHDSEQVSLDVTLPDGRNWGFWSIALVLRLLLLPGPLPNSHLGWPILLLSATRSSTSPFTKLPYFYPEDGGNRFFWNTDNRILGCTVYISEDQNPNSWYVILQTV
jgi:hypothetical protein